MRYKIRLPGDECDGDRGWWSQIITEAKGDGGKGAVIVAKKGTLKGGIDT